MSPLSPMESMSRRVKAGLLAVWMLALVLTPGLLATEAASPSLEPGRRLRLELNAGEAVVVSLETFAGTQLTLLAKGQGRLQPQVTVLAPDGKPITTEPGGRRVLSGHLTTTGGAHQVHVEAPADQGGIVILRLRVGIPRKLTLVLEPDGSAQAVLFAVGPLAPLRVTIRGPAGATVVATSLTDPAGDAVDLTGRVVTRAKGRVLQLGPLETDDSGAYTLNLQLLGGDPPLPDEPPDIVVRVRTRFTRSFGLR